MSTEQERQKAVDEVVAKLKGTAERARVELGPLLNKPISNPMVARVERKPVERFIPDIERNGGHVARTPRVLNIVAETVNIEL